MEYLYQLLHILVEVSSLSFLQFCTNIHCNVTIITCSLDILSSETTNEHLLLVLRELQEKEQTLKDCQEQLEQYRRKFAVIIHQQVVLI